MSEFKTIESQEQLDAILGERLKRAAETAEKKYEGWTSPDDLEKIKTSYDQKIKALKDAASSTQATIDEKDAKIAEGEKYRTDLEKTRIAVSAGLGIDFADRLKGETKEEWQKDAKTLADQFKNYASEHTPVPLGSNEPANKDNGKDAAWASMLNNLAE